ncbi:hypothetical protein J7F03_34090 [Streptomyces sp. ISL-43]|uniref:LppU/SCO3897 family protein n=1 Tax=Streptomyces sp. ISL-43 TaxID=2819183 RepID=UPI001BE73AAA|nr:hypothetical protein [Streptomyces sp. ISL-43]MBT2452003.1 hypothetical protein [Streptomyces sp. ISL-43]
MSSEELPLTITPQQATYGVILTVRLSTGPARLRIPPSKDGDLVRARVGDREVLVRIRVGPAAGAAPAGPTAGPGPAPTQSAPAVSPWVGTPNAQASPAPPAAPRASGARGCLVAAGVLAAVAVVALVLSRGDGGGDGEDTAAPPPAPSLSAWSPTPTPPAAGAPEPADTAPAVVPEPVLPSTEAPAPTPFDRGTCLNGELPDSTTAQRVTGVEEVSCSASDAHYRVIESIPMTSDLDRCNDNPKTQYAFSYRYTRNGVPINQYVYCLVGIGSYAR